MIRLMKAAQINRYGNYEVLELNQSVHPPTASEGKILIEMKAASINPFDLKLMSGMYKEMIPLSFPAVLGGDFSGIVKQVGENITEYKIGDELYGSASILSGGSGSLAELAIAKKGSVALKPKNVSFAEAAALPLVGSSAVQALEEHIKLQRGQKILIHGGAGGIGHIAIQLAKQLGAYVVTTVSTDDQGFVKSIGADEAIDYKKEKFEERLQDLEAVFDTVGGGTANKSIQVLKSGGFLVSMVDEPDTELTKKYKVTALRQATKTNSQHLNRVRELVEAGKIKVSIDKVFPLDQSQTAFKHQTENHPRGKVVVKI